MATRKDLELAVKHLNDSYMTKEPNIFEVDGAYGGVKVVLTGKAKKVGKKIVWRGIGSAATDLTHGYGSSVDKMSDSRLWETYKRQVGWVVRYIVDHSK